MNCGPLDPGVASRGHPSPFRGGMEQVAIVVRSREYESKDHGISSIARPGSWVPALAPAARGRDSRVCCWAPRQRSFANPRLSPSNALLTQEAGFSRGARPALFTRL